MTNLFFDILFFSIILFCVGSFGIYGLRKNLIVILMSLEMLLFAVNLNFIGFSVILDDVFGQIAAVVVLTVAAAESALGLALIVIFYRLRGVLNLDDIRYLKG